MLARVIRCRSMATIAAVGRRSLVSSAVNQQSTASCSPLIQPAGAASMRAFHVSNVGRSSDKAITRDDFEHATGLELAELEGIVAGHDIFTGNDEKWLYAPTGTEENPVVVTSLFEERIVGATDPDDDSLVEWGIVKLGAAPKLIGSEYFVLKQIGDGSHGHH